LGYSVRKGLLWVVSIVLIAFFSMILACSTDDKPDGSKKVIIIGIDGADWTIIERLLAEKKLPTFAELLDKGCGGVLESIPPLISPAIWTTIATGRPRADHGVSNSIAKVHGCYAKTHFTSWQRKTKALWNILSGKGLSTGVIRWFVTYPAEEINGFVISFRYEDHVARDEHDAYYPDSLRHQCEELEETFSFPIHSLVRKVMSLSTEGFATDDRKGIIGKKRVQFTKNVLTRDTKVTFVAKSLLAQHQPNLTMVYLNGVDRVSHKFWKFQNGRFKEEDFSDTTGEERDIYRNMVDEYYCYTDFLVGVLLKTCHPDTEVVIISDHGFKTSRFPENVYFQPNKLLADLGLLAFDGDDDVAYERTLAFNFFDSYRSVRGIFLNVKNRDPFGVVKEADLVTTAEAICSTLEGIQTIRGKPLFKWVRINSREEQSTFQEPDIVFELNDQIRYDGTITVKGEKKPFSRYAWTDQFNTGDHREAGAVILSGESFSPGEIKRATILDIAPTVLSLFDMPKARDMPGRVLEECLVSPCPKAMPASYEEPGMKRTHGRVETLSHEAEEKLRSLGYLQ
jgi:predicted AlkP superfamily phosphohydrolase/phosphomutase